MSDVQVALVYVGRDMAHLPVQGEVIGLETLTLSGVSQQTTLQVPDDAANAARSGSVYWIVTPYGSQSCFASQGAPPPAASATTGRVCLYMLSTPFKANPGEKLALILAT